VPTVVRDGFKGSATDALITEVDVADDVTNNAAEIVSLTAAESVSCSVSACDIDTAD
jgi:hypothetical protein